MPLPDTAAASCSFHVLSRIRARTHTHTQHYIIITLYARPLTQTGTGRVLNLYVAALFLSADTRRVRALHWSVVLEELYYTLYLCCRYCSWLNAQSFYPHLFLRDNNASDLRREQRWGNTFDSYRRASALSPRPETIYLIYVGDYIGILIYYGCRRSSFNFFCFRRYTIIILWFCGAISNDYISLFSQSRVYYVCIIRIIIYNIQREILLSSPELHRGSSAVYIPVRHLSTPMPPPTNDS